LERTRYVAPPCRPRRLGTQTADAWTTAAHPAAGSPESESEREREKKKESQETDLSLSVFLTTADDRRFSPLSPSSCRPIGSPIAILLARSCGRRKERDPMEGRSVRHRSEREKKIRVERGTHLLTPISFCRR